MTRRTRWRHQIRLLVADDALAGRWGAPVPWAREALTFIAPGSDDPLAARSRDLLRRASAYVPRRGRGDTPVPDRLRASGVTGREMDVLRLIGQGQGNSAIAQQLVPSPRTHETHVTNLIAKTNAIGREGLAKLVTAYKDQRSGRGVNIFLSYRGMDGAWAVVLDDHLSARFGAEQVFRASRSLRP